ncbi:unknown [[Clostridium] leptum CAG:27]|uniref:Uncharacterized protein n=1 Tax=[Clostridium] leptum CAG:27 TaxID=1263068 RepID=R6MXX0_9FIRM|nr:unknown [[Clostridium] leptum CAG:27]
MGVFIAAVGSNTISIYKFQTVLSVSRDINCIIYASRFAKITHKGSAGGIVSAAAIHNGSAYQLGILGLICLVVSGNQRRFDQIFLRSRGNNQIVSSGRLHILNVDY